MTTTTKRIIILALMVVYVILLFAFYYPTYKANCCNDGQPTEEETSTLPPVDTANVYPLAGRWDTLGIFAGPGLNELQARINQGRKADNILEITGLYYESEATPQGEESMGLARAAQIRDRYFADIPNEQISLRAFLQNDVPGVQTGFFPAARLQWIEPAKPVEEEKAEVEVLADRVIIRFPTNSTNRISDPAVDEYIAKLAQQIQTTGGRVTLTGHTDGDGTDEANMTLGQGRANAIRDLLIQNGIDAGLITTESRGESQPVASNATEEGKRQNRRVEVRFIAPDESTQ